VLAPELERLRARVAELEAGGAALRDTEAQLRGRLAVLTGPFDGNGSPRLQDLIDVDELQVLQDALADATGVASIITDTRGVPITRPSRFCRLCLHVIRGTPRGLANCMASDAELGGKADGPTIRPCRSGGLLDGGASICVGDRHIANWLIGQVIDERCDPERLLEYADQIGADREEFRGALAEVARMPRERFEQVGRTLFLFAGTLSRLAYQNLQQARNIAERERARRTAKESEERYRSLFESSRDAIVSIDLDGRFTDVNPAVSRMLGYTREELLARTYRDVTPARWHAMNDAILCELVPTRGYSDEYEKEYERKDGTLIPVKIRAFVRRDFAGQMVGTWAIIRDLTDERRLETQFRAAQKLESIGRLAGGVAHDFNNLLTVILSGANGLKDDLERGSPPDGDIVREIVGAGERARDLTRQLLTFARRQVIDPVPSDLNALVRGSESLLRRVLREDLELSVSLHGSLWPVRCDPVQIEQVILNLAVNARDAMPNGGKLAIETANVEIDERLTASRPWLRPGPYARLSFHDSGHGMSPEVQGHLFEPFFTTKPVGRGTGLGLATVYGIVKQSDGYILVDSEVDCGARFDLYFPRFHGGGGRRRARRARGASDRAERNRDHPRGRGRPTGTRGHAPLASLGRLPRPRRERRAGGVRHRRPRAGAHRRARHRRRDARARRARRRTGAVPPSPGASRAVRLGSRRGGRREARRAQAWHRAPVEAVHHAIAPGSRAGGPRSAVG